MSQLLLSIEIILCLALVLRFYGLFSIVGASCVGMLVYSIPAVVGVARHYHDNDPTVGDVSPASIYAIGLAWLVYLTVLFLLGPSQDHPAHSNGRRIEAPSSSLMEAFWISCLAISLLLYLLISMKNGPFYFLEPRQKQNIVAEVPKILWAWVNLFGILAALSMRRYVVAALFAALLLVTVVAGDRTMFVISAAAVGILILSGQRVWRVIRDWRLLSSVGVAAFVVLWGKSALTYYKYGQLDIERLIPQRSGLVQHFEPLVIQNTLDRVIESGFHYSVSDLLSGVFGQFLIIPSRFGIDSSLWNKKFETALSLDLNWNVAYSYFGQGYSVGGWVGVAIFSTVFAVALVALDRAVVGKFSPLRLLALVLGSLVAVYTYRNSLENLLAFVRQIAIAFFPCLIGALVLDRGVDFFKRRGRRHL